MRRAMKASLVALTALALLSAACRTVSTREVSSVPGLNVRVGTRARTWELRRGDDVLGLVVLFEDRRRAQDSVYVVRNAWSQDLGLIDALGRAFRYVPHLEEPVWVGSGTIAAGAQRILATDAECELVELDAADPLPGSEPTGAASAAASPDVGLPQSR
jgi:hypothetical protein